MWNVTKMPRLAEQGGFNTITINWKDGKVEWPARVFLLLNLSLARIEKVSTRMSQHFKHKKYNIYIIYIFFDLHPTVALGTSWPKGCCWFHRGLKNLLPRCPKGVSLPPCAPPSLYLCLSLSPHFFRPLPLHLFGFCFNINMLTHRSSFIGLLSDWKTICFKWLVTPRLTS